MSRNKSVLRFIDGKWTMVPCDQDIGPTKEESAVVHQDSMAPLEHPETGEICESKSRFRAINKEHGLVELGNDRNKKERTEVGGIAEDVKRVVAAYRTGGDPEMQQHIKETREDLARADYERRNGR